MGVRDILDGKRQWRAHVARVKGLPDDYRIVYDEMQKYLFKVGPTSLIDGGLLEEIVDFFEDGVSRNIGVMALVGDDVAAFCDGLIEGTPTYLDEYNKKRNAKSS